MKKINPALPMLAAALLAVSACAKQNDAANTATVGDITSNDESVVVDNGLDGNATGTEPLGNDAAEPQNATATPDNGQ